MNALSPVADIAREPGGHTAPTTPQPLKVRGLSERGISSVVPVHRVGISELLWTGVCQNPSSNICSPLAARDASVLADD